MQIVTVGSSKALTIILPIKLHDAHTQILTTALQIKNTQLTG